jgi:S1-C subfamily serine protease
MVKRIALILSCAVLAGVTAGAVRADEEGNQLQALLAKVAPSVATVRAVIKTEDKGEQGPDQESRVALTGVVVSEDGLIMMTNIMFSPKRFYQLMGYPASSLEQYNVKVTPTAFKVTFGQEDKEYDAFLAATDASLDLAFVKVEGLGDRKLTPVDFSSSTPPTVGQKIVTVSRLEKGYDYAPYYQCARISGEVNKPRKAWMLDGSVPGFGAPIFAMNGDVVGVLTTVISGFKDESAAGSMGFSMMMRMLGGGGGVPGGVFVLPGQTIKAVIDQAGKRAVEVAAERAKKAAEKPATTTPAKPAVNPAAPKDGKDKGKPAGKP